MCAHRAIAGLTKFVGFPAKFVVGVDKSAEIVYVSGFDLFGRRLMADKAKKIALSVKPSRSSSENSVPTSHRCVGAQGFGLNQDQQKAIADLWAWQEQSLRSKIVLGGPVA